MLFTFYQTILPRSLLPQWGSVKTIVNTCCSSPTYRVPVFLDCDTSLWYRRRHKPTHITISLGTPLLQLQ